MLQKDESSQEVEKMTVSPEDVGSIDILLGTSPEPVPVEAKVKKVVGKKKETKKVEKINWSPIDNPKIIAHLDAAAEEFIALDCSYHRNDGASKYVSFDRGKRRAVAGALLGKKTARIITGKHVDKKTSWPKEYSWQVTEKGYSRDGQSVKLSSIVSRIKTFIAAKGW